MCSVGDLLPVKVQFSTVAPLKRVALVYGPITGRAGERAIFDRNVIGVDNHCRVAKIDAAEHRVRPE